MKRYHSLLKNMKVSNKYYLLDELLSTILYGLV